MLCSYVINMINNISLKFLIISYEQSLISYRIYKKRSTTKHISVIEGGAVEVVTRERDGRVLRDIKCGPCRPPRRPS